MRILLVEDAPSDAAMTVEAIREGRILNQMHVVGDGEFAMAYLRQQGRFADAARLRRSCLPIGGDSGAVFDARFPLVMLAILRQSRLVARLPARRSVLCRMVLPLHCERPELATIGVSRSGPVSQRFRAGWPMRK